eukprot:scaffold10545_cov441-Chaetoceros_neogracile.AAC.5
MFERLTSMTFDRRSRLSLKQFQPPAQSSSSDHSPFIKQHHHQTHKSLRSIPPINPISHQS